MRFAIVESGGKQYRTVEGRSFEVDRLPVETGEKFDFDRVLLMADGDEIMVGTPTLSDINVKVTVMDHVRGPKIDRFKYRPKKRIRVRGGHRQHYTLLMVDFIGKPGEKRKVEPPKVEKEAPVEVVEAEAKPKAEKKAKPEKESTAASTKKAPAKKESTSKKSTSTKSPSKKTDSKKK